MIVITGANGHLATGVARHIRTLAADAVVIGTARRVDATPDVYDQVRYADYDVADSLATAFAGAGVVILVSGTAFGRRIAQHSAAIVAARRIGAGHVIYTSAPRVDSSDLVFAAEHLGTERTVRTSGVPYTILRNNWYHENYAATIATAAATGTFTGNAGEGRVASAARDDYAEATARIAVNPAAHRDSTYELAGDTAWTYGELAAMIGAIAGTEVSYRNVSTSRRRADLSAAGRTPAEIEAVAGVDDNIAHGALEFTDGTLRRLLGRPTTPLRDSIERVLSSAGHSDDRTRPVR